jgi:hypothetical protein
MTRITFDIDDDVLTLVERYARAENTSIERILKDTWDYRRGIELRSMRKAASITAPDFAYPAGHQCDLPEFRRTPGYT